MVEQVGRYKIKGQLGRGAMGVVYLADDPLLNRQAAIKTVDLSGGDPGQAEFLRTRLLRDARAAAGLSHPNIVGVFDVVEEGEAAYLVMEYIPGETLAAILARTPIPDAAFTLRVLSDMAAALDYTHARGIVHRDIKPANVMIDTSQTAKIMDFGIARIADTRTTTPTGMVMGTIEYMSPEQIKGEAVDGRSDQFALVGVAFRMLTGTTVFGQHSLATLAYKIVNEAPPPVRMHNAGLPPAVDLVVSRGMAKSAAERYATCTDFVNALTSAIFAPNREETTASMMPPVPPATVSAPPPAPMPSTAFPAGQPPSAPMPSAAFPQPPSAPAPSAAFPQPQVAPMPSAAFTAPAPVPPPPAAKSGKGALVGVLAILILAGAGLAMWRPWEKPAPVTNSNPPTQTAQTSTQPESQPGDQKPTPAAAPPAPTAVPVETKTAIKPTPAPTPAPTPTPKQPTTGLNASAASSAAEDVAPMNETSPPEPPTPQVPKPAVEAHDLGLKLLGENRADAAIEQFNKAINLRPEWPPTYLDRGRAYQKQGDCPAAIRDYTKFLQMRPQNAFGHIDRGQCYVRLSDDNHALQDFNAAIGLKTDAVNAYFGRAYIHMRRNEFRLAVADFDACIRFAPEFISAYTGRGNAKRKLGDEAGAQADFRHARELKK